MNDNGNLAVITNITEIRARKDAEKNPNNDPTPPTSPKGGRGRKVQTESLDTTSSFQGRSLAA